MKENHRIIFAKDPLFYHEFLKEGYLPSSFLRITTNQSRTMKMTGQLYKPPDTWGDPGPPLDIGGLKKNRKFRESNG